VHDTAEYALFSRAEMDRRYNRTRELMAKRGIDTLLITGEENFHYFSGTSASIGLHASLTRPSVFILPLERDPIILTQGRDYIILSTYVSDIRSYDDVLSFPPGVVLEALKDLPFKHNRIGAELGQEQRMGIPVGAYLGITESLKKTEFVDAADIIIKMRMVKSNEELVYIRKAAEITGRARQRLFRDHVTPGMTEHDVARTLKRLILEEGGDGTSFIHLQLDLPGCKNQFHYDRPLKPGSVLAVDAGAYARMYTIDYPRMATLGKATELQKKVHRIVREVTRKMADALKPGLRCSELHRVAVEAIEASGASADRPEKLRGGSRFGHGQGMQLTEPPSVNPKDHTELEVGTVLSTEPGVRIGDVHFLWEDVHVITESGHEQLTLESPDLVAIPW
jgi:Xaa-Pro aminopeptidase